MKQWVAKNIKKCDYLFYFSLEIEQLNDTDTPRKSITFSATLPAAEGVHYTNFTLQWVVELLINLNFLEIKILCTA